MAWVEPLNLETILISNLAGDANIFLFVSLIMMSAMAAFFRMSNGVFFLMFTIYSVFIGTLANDFIWIIIAISAPLIVWGLTRAMKQ